MNLEQPVGEESTNIEKFGKGERLGLGVEVGEVERIFIAFVVVWVWVVIQGCSGHPYQVLLSSSP